MTGEPHACKHRRPPHHDRVPRLVERCVFGSRLLLVPIYFGLILALLVYTVKFFQAGWVLLCSFARMDQGQLLLAVLELLDQTMIASLISLIAIGSYSTFVSEMKFENGAHKPQWLNHISPGTLKTKMGASIVGVSSIHLLSAFINAEHMDWDVVCKMMLLHGLFVLSTLALWYIAKDDFAHQKQGAEDHGAEAKPSPRMANVRKHRMGTHQAHRPHNHRFLRASPEAPTYPTAAGSRQTRIAHPLRSRLIGTK